MMVFNYKEKILFKYCDPAGIVFYPRYFEMVNDCVETFFADHLNWPFEEVLKNGGVPTVSINADFKAVSRHGEVLDLELSVGRVGNSSVNLLIRAMCEHDARFEVNVVLVNIDLSGKSSAWPADVATQFSQMIQDSNDT